MHSHALHAVFSLIKWYVYHNQEEHISKKSYHSINLLKSSGFEITEIMAQKAQKKRSSSSTSTKLPPTEQELRSKAAVRAVFKLTDMTPDSESQLWSIARVLSDNEFQNLVEERSGWGLCGFALCPNMVQTSSLELNSSFNNKGKYKISMSEKKVYAVDNQPSPDTMFCSAHCLKSSAIFAKKLGSSSQALERFEILLSKVRAEKALKTRTTTRIETSSIEDTATTTSMETEEQQPPAPPSPPSSTDSSANKPKSILKKKTESAADTFAAGSAKKPIMLAEVKERDSSGTTHPSSSLSSFQNAAAAMSSSSSSHAVEGYVPRSTHKLNKDKDEVVEEDQQQRRRVRIDENLNTTARIDGKSSGIAPSDDNDNHYDNNSSIIDGHTPVLVFDVEDPLSPLEGSGSLAARFGTLRVVDTNTTNDRGDSDGVNDKRAEINVEEPNSSTTAAPAAAPAIGPGEPIDLTGHLDKLLTQQLRAGVRRLDNSKLSTKLPPELEAALADSDDDDEEENDDEGSDWMKSDDDDNNYDEWGEHNNNNINEEDDDVEGDRSKNNNSNKSLFRVQLTFFGRLFTSLENWVTDATLELINIGALSSTGTRDAAIAQSASSPQVMASLSGFLSRAVPAVISQLAIAEQELMTRDQIERHLDELLRTMRLIGPVPGFTPLQWQLVVMILLKALSLERVPALRPAFETHPGIKRLNKALVGVCFTIEEYYAVLELMVLEVE